jgi:hypothetical protein
MQMAKTSAALAKLKKSGIPFMKSTALANLHKQQIKKMNAALSTLHEDLQYDYLQMIDEC